jgi:hypothetical protein
MTDVRRRRNFEATKTEEKEKENKEKRGGTKGRGVKGLKLEEEEERKEEGERKEEEEKKEEEEEGKDEQSEAILLTRDSDDQNNLDFIQLFNSLFWDIVILLIMAYYLVWAPYTKVEESFNLQAMHE